jgi:DNA ligase-1
MKFIDLVRVSGRVAQVSGRLEKISTLASLLSQLADDELPIALGFLTGWPRQGRLGIGWATVSSLRDAAAATTPSLELRDVDSAFENLRLVVGKRSGAERARLLTELYARATAEEHHFLSALLLGEVRHGALEGVLLEAVARAAGVSSDRVRRAVMLAGDMGTVAHALRRDGEAVLDKYQIELFRPVQPMLADSAPTIEEALTAGEPVTLEWKLDGARIQVHRRDERVAVYTRNLNDVTDRVPEVVECVLTFAAREFILDGEVIALDDDQRPRPFQTTMRRFGRRLDVDALRAELPLAPFFFDLLWSDREPVLDLPLSERLERLDRVVPTTARVPRIRTVDVAAAKDFESDTLARGHEGVMVKLLAAPYAAGRRGSAWVKVKTARTLDLVVLAAEWGSGRRQGWLSNLHLGARDAATDDFVMLGKTFKGMTDEMLEWQTKELLAREVRREGHIVFVRPELVVEIAFNEVQHSRYPGGVALRFARVKGYRPDKRAAEADTIDAVRAFLT